MTRSAAISWTIGLAVSSAALSLWQLPAKADDGGVDKVETRPQPIEPKTVRVILLPPASDAVFGLRPPGSATAAHVISVQPVGETAAAPPPLKSGKIQEDAAFVEGALHESPPRAALQPSASNAPTAQPRAEPAKIRDDAASVEPPASPGRPPQVALLPPASDVASDQPRAEPAKPRKDASLVEIPSLPERPPFRTVLYDVEPVENEREAAASFREQPREPASLMGRVNSVFQPLANLWPGNRRANEEVSPTTEDNGRSVARPAFTDADPASDKADAGSKPASFLKTLRFWER